MATLSINGKDLSSYIKDEGETIEYVKIHGDHEGVVLSGSTIEEILAIKVQLSYPCEYLTWDQLKELAVLVSNDIVQVTYYDPKESGERTVNMKPSMSAATKVLEQDGIRYYGGATIDLEED